MKIAVCSIINNEQDYLNEWLEHHLKNGIDEIYLYEDYESRSHLKITNKYGDRVKLFSIHEIFVKSTYNDYTIQEKLLNWFLENFKDKFDWILCINIDEFLTLNCSIHDLLEEYSNKDCILLPYKWYCASGHIKKPDGGVMENYAVEVRKPFHDLLTYKTFINAKRFDIFESHNYAINCDSIYPLNEYGEYKAFINHYITKSWEEWKYKLLRTADLCQVNCGITKFFTVNTDLLSYKNDLLLEIAIDNAKKLGFNKNIDITNSSKKYFHFCWFGGNDFNDINLLCIESWRNYLSDEYIVCLWNELCFDYLDITFTKEAYHCKKWAFVSDYVRLWAIYTYGGVYFDTDVELLKSIDFLPSNFFAIESGYDKIAVGLGFGADKGNKLIGDLLNFYKNLPFIVEIMRDFAITTIITEYFERRGYEINLTDIHEYLGFIIYPPEYFCPKNYITQHTKITENTVSIHHYIASWNK